MATEPQPRSAIDQRGQYVAGDQFNYVQTIVLESGSDEFERVLSLTSLQVQEPPKPRYPPLTGEFVGRGQELYRYRDQLMATGVAVITGMPGVGKTALAAELAADIAPKSHIFWHGFDEGEEGIVPLAGQVAGFLARTGRPNIWNMLNKSSSKEPDSMLGNYLVQEVSGPGYCLWFDDYHNVLGRVQIRSFIEQLAIAASHGQLYLIITSRLMTELGNVENDPLDGLTLDDTALLLERQGLHLPEQTTHELRRHLGGNPQLLLLAAGIPDLAAEPEWTITRLAEADSIERYLFEKVDDTLTEAERAVMEAASVLTIGDAGSQRAVERLYGGSRRIRRLLLGLRDRRLLAVDEHDGQREYRQNPVLQTFYYAGIPAEERILLHAKAAQFYEVDSAELSFLRAAIHHEQAGEFERAAELSINNAWLLVNQFELSKLGLLLARLQEQSLSDRSTIRVTMTRALIAGIWGQNDLALEGYMQAIEALKAGPKWPESDRLLVDASIGVCRILLNDDPLKALEWAMFGQSIVDGTDEAEIVQQRAVLAIVLGGAFFRLGRMQDAHDSLQHGLTLLGPDVGALHAEALINLQVLYFIQGDYERSRYYATAAIEIGNHLENVWLLHTVLSNAAPADFESGNWSPAIDKLEQALRLSEQLMDKPGQVSREANLGEVYLRLECRNEAEKHLLRALELAKECAARSYQMAAMCALASLHVLRKEWELAASILDSAEEMARQTGDRYMLGEVSHQWARFHFARDASEDSLRHAQNALEIAREMGNAKQEGEILRLLGLVLIALGKRVEGQIHLERSLTVLEGGDPLEESRTRLKLGLLQVDLGDVQTGQQNIKDAQRVLNRVSEFSRWCDSERKKNG